MKRLQTIAGCLLAFVLAGVISLKSAEPGKIEGKAIVRTISGKATYTSGGGSLPLKVNMELPASSTITTGPDSFVLLNVNGLSSAVRIDANTTMGIEKMIRIGAEREGDTETMLNLNVGSILGQVKKVSANSSYEIKTPRGVAGIRGTDFQITVLQLPNGHYQVTYTSVQGLVYVAATVNNEMQTRVLHDGESWTPGDGEIFPTPLNLLDQWKHEINNFPQPTPPPGPPPSPPPWHPPGQNPSSD